MTCIHFFLYLFVALQCAPLELFAQAKAYFGEAEKKYRLLFAIYSICDEANANESLGAREKITIKIKFSLHRDEYEKS